LAAHYVHALWTWMMIKPNALGLVSNSTGAPPSVETMCDPTCQQWQCCVIPRATGIT